MSKQHLNSLNGKNSRIELKYRLSYVQYYKVKISILPFMEKDFFTLRSACGRYFVRSLYYDTHDYRLYDHKMSGDSERVKFRLRTYDSRFSDDTCIRAEIKTRQGNETQKYSNRVSKLEYDCFMDRKHWSRFCSNPVLAEFERCVHLKTMSPKVLIDYEREGYKDRGAEGIRVTFDHKVRSAQATALFSDQHVFFRVHHPGVVVLEIKCRNHRPRWIQEIIRVHGLKTVANSKFTQAIESARHDLYHPDGLVVVR